MVSAEAPSEQLHRLREEFDASFSDAPTECSVTTIDLLVVGVGEDRHAVKLSDCGGVLSDRAVALVPSDVVGFLGVAGHRGALVAVYDLGWILRRVSIQAPRWLLLDAAEAVAYAFSTFDGFYRVAMDAVVDASGGEGTARVGTQSLPLIDLIRIRNSVRIQLQGPSNGE